MPGPFSVFSSSRARVALVAAAVLLLWPGPSYADWFITPLVGAKFAGTTNFVDLEQGAGNTKLTIGVAGGMLGDGPLGFEGEFGYSPRFFERARGSGLVARSHVLTLMGNVIVAVPRRVTGLSLRPFVSGGAGLMNVSVDDVAGALTFDSNLVAINAGGGATGALTHRSSVRLELRYFKSVTQEDDTPRFGPTRLSFWRAAVGLTVR